MKNKFLLGLLLVPFMFLATACGDDDGGDDTPPAEDIDLIGTWTLAPSAGALAVGPADGDYSWWENSADDVGIRSCLFDDTWEFTPTEAGATTGTVTISQGGNTWLEGWQGMDPEGCGAPVAPFTGGTFDWSFDETAGTLTITGNGAWMGLPKARNDGEMGNGGNPGTDSGSIVFTANSVTSSTAVMRIASGTTYWQFTFAKQ